MCFQDLPEKGRDIVRVGICPLAGIDSLQVVITYRDGNTYKDTGEEGEREHPQGKRAGNPVKPGRQDAIGSVFQNYLIPIAPRRSHDRRL